MIIVAVLFAYTIRAAVTTTTPAVDNFPPRNNAGAFMVNATSSDASACEALVAAPGSGKYIFVKHITINATSPNSVTVGEGETTPGSVDTVLVGPVYLGAGTSLQWEFNPPLKLTTNKSLTVDTSDTGKVMFFIQGYIE